LEQNVCVRRSRWSVLRTVATAVVVAALCGASSEATVAAGKSSTTATAPASSGTTSGSGAGAVPPPPGSACGQTIDLPARRSLGIGGAPLAIGDSVLYDAAQPLADYGFHVNAMVCRTMDQGISWLTDHAHGLPALVVVALGTNGGASGGQISELLSILGPHRILALVTPHNGNDPSTPALYREAARRDPYRIELLDWDRRSAGHPDWFASDGIHLGGAAGVTAFARLIVSSLLGPTGPSAPATPTPSTTIQPSAPPPPKPAPRHRVVAHASPRSVNAGAVMLAAVEAVGLSLVQG
jgi:hypothetical protein